MPELPEVETIRRGLVRTIVGKTIKSVEVRLPKIISLGPATVSNIRKASKATALKFASLLRGHKIAGIKRRAKMLLIDLSGPYTLLVHLKMTGQLIFAKKQEQKVMKIFNLVGSRRLELPHQYTHVIFTFTDGSRLYYNDIRQFGYLRLVPDNQIAEVRELADYGPEPLGKDFTFEYLLSKIKIRPKLTVKQFITEPKIVAGVGNIYSDEILYCAKIRPTRKVKNLQNAEWKALYKCTPQILKEAVLYQGSSVGDFFKVDGSEGRYGHIHRVYGRGGEHCRKCGGFIKTVKLGGRTSSYCPICQR